MNFSDASELESVFIHVAVDWSRMRMSGPRLKVRAILNCFPHVVPGGVGGLCHCEERNDNEEIVGSWFLWLCWVKVQNYCRHDSGM